MDLASIDKLLTTTRSVRKRLDLTRPVEPEMIQQCLDIATQAPTGGGICRYYFVVVTDPAKRQGLADLYRKAFAKRFSPDLLEEIRRRQPHDVESWEYLAEHLHEVPVHIVSCVELQAPMSKETAMAYILPATWSLMLALHARGIGSAWTIVHKVYHPEEAATLLGIPENIHQAVLLPVVYYKGEDFKPAKRIPAHEQTFWDMWGHTR